MSGVGITNISNLSVPASQTGKEEAAPTRAQQLPASGNNSPQQQAEVSPEQVEAAVSEISDYIQQVSRNLQFQVDADTGSTIITVIDGETDEVIRTIPREEMLALAKHIADNSADPLKGLLMNDKG